MCEASRKRPRTYKILDVTSQIEKNNLPETPDFQHDQSHTKHTRNITVRLDKSPSTSSMEKRNASTFEEDSPQTGHDMIFEPDHTRWLPESPSFFTPDSMAASHSDCVYSTDESIIQPHKSSESTRLHLQSRQQHSSIFSNQSVLTTQSISEIREIPNIPATRSPIHTENAAADLLALRYMPSQLSQTQPIAIEMAGMRRASDMLPPIRTSDVEHVELPMLDPQLFDNSDPQVDGIFLPGSAYQELHSTLRDHLIYTARSNAPTRHGTPEPMPDMGFFERDQTRIVLGNYFEGRVDSTITPQREYGMSCLPNCTLKKTS